jgi:hypothetical protein
MYLNHGSKFEIYDKIFSLNNLNKENIELIDKVLGYLFYINNKNNNIR